MRLWRAALGAAALALAGCGGGEANNQSADEAEEGAEIPDSAVLADDPELANEAAADEAADTQTYGGNAAAGETGNAGAAR